jgi:hypothetical protein
MLGSFCILVYFEQLVVRAEGRGWVRGAEIRMSCESPVAHKSLAADFFPARIQPINGQGICGFLLRP